MSQMITFYHDIEQDFDSKADVYECRKMVSEFLKLERKYNISSTYNVVGKLFIEQPDLIDLIINEGQEIAFHSYNHQRDWKPEYFSNEIELCRKVSPIPNGYRSPRSQINQTAVQTLWEEGFIWTAERDQHSEPYYIYKDLIRLPITADDWPLYVGKVTTNEWVQKFAKLLQNGSYIAFGLHDFVATINPGEILNAWDKILERAVAQKALSLNFSEAADLFRRASDSKKVVSNSQINHTYKNNLPKEFEDLISGEIKKLNNPQIVFLCRQYDELPPKYKEIVEKNNCLVIESSNYYNKNDKEMLNDKIELSSVDLFICAYTIEHNFFLDNLAKDIKKRCKLGASFIINFSYSIENVLLGDESDAEYVDNHLTPSQIIRWASQIGQGSLVRSNNNTLDLKEYSLNYIEINKYSKKKINHYVYIGNVQNRNRTSRNNRVIPLSKANFLFPNPIIEGYKISIENTGLKIIRPLKELVKKVLLH